MNFSRLAALCTGLIYALEVYNRRGPKDLPDSIRYARPWAAPIVSDVATFEPLHLYAAMNLLAEEMRKRSDVFNGRLLNAFSYTFTPDPDSDGVMCSYILKLDIPMSSLGVYLHVSIFCRGDGQFVPSAIQVSDPQAWIAWNLPLLPASGDWPQVIKSKEVNDMLVFFARYWKDYQKDLTGAGVMRLNRVIDCCST